MKTDPVNNLITKIILETATPDDFFAVSETFLDLQTFFNHPNTVDVLLSFGVKSRGLTSVILLSDIEDKVGKQRYLLTRPQNTTDYDLDSNKISQISHRVKLIYDIKNTISRTEV